MDMRRILAATAATVMVASGVVFASAAPASAVPPPVITSFGPGSVPSSLVVAWTADDPDRRDYIGIAKAAAFNPDTCDYREWNRESLDDPANLLGYFYVDDVSNPHEFTSYTDWNFGDQFAVEQSTEYVACYFGYFTGGSVPVYAFSSGSGSGASASAPRPIWYLALGRASAEATCPDNYTSSWAQWPNAGTGGWVCNREVFADEPLS